MYYVFYSLTILCSDCNDVLILTQMIILLKVVFKQKLYQLENISTAVTDLCKAHEWKGIKHTCVGRLGRGQFHNWSKFIRNHCCYHSDFWLFLQAQFPGVTEEQTSHASLSCLQSRMCEFGLLPPHQQDLHSKIHWVASFPPWT